MGAHWEMITHYGDEVTISVGGGGKEVDIDIEGDVVTTLDANGIDTLIAALTEARRAIS